MNIRVPLITAIVVLGACAMSAAPVWAQKDAVAQSDPIEKLAQDREKALVKAIYSQTLTAKTATDFTKFIDACRDGAKKKISQKNQKYLKSLEAWGLNRRGLCRCDLAKFLLQANSNEQANEVFDQALADFEASLAINPNNWRPHLGKGLVQAERGDLLGAIDTFSSLCESHPKQSAIRFNRAELYYQLARYEKALADYDYVLELSSADLQAVTGRAHCLTQLGRTEEALKEYLVVAKMVPGNNWALINAADANQTLGNWSDAYDGYVAAMTAKPDAAGYQKAAWMLATCPDQQFFRPGMALQLAEKAVGLGGETRLNLDTLAAAQAATGDYESARKTQALAIAKSAKASPAQTERLGRYENQQPFIQGQDKSDDETLIREN